MRLGYRLGLLSLAVASLGATLAYDRASHAASPVAAEAVALAPTLARLAPPAPVELVADPVPPFLLRLSALNTGERLDVLLPSQGSAGVDALGDVRPGALASPDVWRFFRPRSGHEVPIDARLVDLLGRISRALDGAEIVLVSGHREPGRSTSRKSFHVRGMAADIAVIGVGVQQLRRVAIAEGAGGVGLYPGFVHVDVREEPFRWVGGRWPRR